MLSNIVLSSLILAGTLGLLAGPGAPANLETALTEYYGPEARLRSVSVLLNEKQSVSLKAKCGRTFESGMPGVWRIEQGKSVKGYAFCDDVKGKVRNITYAVFFEPDGTIRGIEILTYRESHGGEVASGMFRSQFEGKSAASELKVGKDIRNISGATISSRAVTGGVKSMALLFQFLKQEGILTE